MPTGSKMPGCSSRMNCRGRRCRISRSAGSSMARARPIGGANVLAGNLAHAAAQLESAAGIHAANVRAAYAHHALVNVDASYALSLLIGCAHHFGRRRQLGDQSLAHSRRLHDAVAAIAQHAAHSHRPPARASPRCRCRAPQSGCPASGPCRSPALCHGAWRRPRGARTASRGGRGRMGCGSALLCTFKSRLLRSFSRGRALRQDRMFFVWSRLDLFRRGVFRNRTLRGQFFRRRLCR